MEKFNMTKIRLALLVLIAIFALGACGGDKLTADEVEKAMQSSFEGDLEPLKKITCDAEKEAMEQTGAPTEGMPEGTSVKVDCSIDGDVATCNMAMTVEIEGAEPQTTEIPLKIKIDDGKLCGTAE
jgi:hypothetical protein